MVKHRDHSNRIPKIMLGKTKFSKIGLPRYDWHDIYHLTLTLSWPVFLALICAIFLGVNALFALAYLGDANGIENARPGSFGDAFFFSVETMATVGYGIMSPKSLYSHIVSMTEIMVGMFGFAVATGLMFTRFSRPRSRILFSDVAVIHSFNLKTSAGVDKIFDVHHFQGSYPFLFSLLMAKTFPTTLKIMSFVWLAMFVIKCLITYSCD